MTSPPPSRRHWLDDPKHVTVVYRVLVAVCVALVGADVLVTRTAHFVWEGWIGFYPVYGFLAYVTVVFVGKQLRRVVGRREDYYDG